MQITCREQAWKIWKEHAPAVRAYLQKRTNDQSLTDDLTQGVAIRVYDACCSNREIKNVRAWLFQIAYHNLVNHYKKSKVPNLVPACCSIESNGTDVYEALSPFLLPMIDFLPMKYALPLKLADLEGKKQQDIATALGLSLTATKSRVQRARKLLKAKINTCFHIQQREETGLVGFALKNSCHPLQKIVKKNNWNAASF